MVVRLLLLLLAAGILVEAMAAPLEWADIGIAVVTMAAHRCSAPLCRGVQFIFALSPSLQQS